MDYSPPSLKPLLYTPKTQQPFLPQPQQSSILFQINFENQPSIKSIYFDQQNEDDLLLMMDFHKIRKKVLQMYNYDGRGKNSIKIKICNFYEREEMSQEITVNNKRDYAMLVRHMVIDKQYASIALRVIVVKQLQKKGKRVEDLEFDSDGSIQSVENDTIRKAINMNRPYEKKYRGDGTVRCSICSKSNQNKQSTKRLGPLYGPFQCNNYIHLLCALWNRFIFVDKASKLSDVEKGLKNTSNIQCSYCQFTGASQCHNYHTSQCEKSSHYQCAIRHNWKLNWLNYRLFCCEQCQIQFDNKKAGGKKKSRPKKIKEVKQELNLEDRLRKMQDEKKIKEEDA